MSELRMGTLRQVLEDACQEHGVSRKSLTVLSPSIDPYRLDTPSNHEEGAWLADLFPRAVQTGRIHLRGLHYALVSLGGVRKPSGGLYRNTDDDWQWLANSAAKAARWLGYIDFERITDARNAAPIIHRRERTDARPYVSTGVGITIPGIGDIEPLARVEGYEGRQPCSLVLFGEKSSLEDVLLPIAQRFQADLYLGQGEISDTLIFQMARDGARDGRPMVVFVVADCDPAGHQMSISIGRKLQAMRDLRFPTLDFELVVVGLTVEQVRELRLPSTPLKETELRADKWRTAFGVEQTEIDALATLQPHVLTRIVTDAVAPWFDRTLDGRVTSAVLAWTKAAQESLDEQIDHAALASVREKAAALCDIEREFNERLETIVPDDVTLPPLPAIPEAKPIADEIRLASLVSSRRSWVEVTRALKARKAYGDGE